MTTIDVTSDPMTSASAFRWRALGKERLTIVVRVTCSFAGGRVDLAPPDPIRTEAMHLEGALAKSLLEATDLVPYLGRAEVFFRGRSFARPGASARLSVLRAAEMLLDKRLLAARHDPAGIPIVYERAHGGSGFAANPIGTGIAQGSAPPDFTHPADPRLPATFLPVPLAWPHRAAAMTDAHRAGLYGASIDIGEGFPWAALQSAPPDQQLAKLEPRDSILLENLVAGEPSVRVAIPAFQVLCDVTPAMAVPPLRIDTVRIDGERRTVSLTYRAVVPLAEPGIKPAVRVVLTSIGTSSRAPEALGSTVLQTADAEVAASRRPIAPFAIGAPKAPNGDGMAAARELWKLAGTSVDAARPGQTRTVGLSIERDLAPPAPVAQPSVVAPWAAPTAPLSPPPPLAMQQHATANAKPPEPKGAPAPANPPPEKPRGPSLGEQFLAKRKR